MRCERAISNQEEKNYKRETNMRKSVIAGLALWAAFAAFAGKTRAEVNYPWCIIGNTRAVDCYFTSREQCAQDGRNRGFGGQCIQNPAYKPGAPTVSGKERTETARPSQTVNAAHSTCTGMNRYASPPTTRADTPHTANRTTRNFATFTGNIA
jgi:hypothetical protein